MATIIDMDRELPAKIYEWIGRISVAYGLYEHTLAATIKRTDPRHDILSAMKLAAALKSTTALQDRAAESFELSRHMDLRLAIDDRDGIDRQILVMHDQGRSG